MPRIFSYMLCDSITNIPSADGRTIPQLSSPQIVLRPAFVPGAVSFGISVGICDIDLNDTNTIRIRVIDPSGAESFDSGESVISIPSTNDSCPREYQGFVISIDFRSFVVKTEGIYNFSIYINGDNIGKADIPVFRSDEQS